MIICFTTSVGAFKLKFVLTSANPLHPLYLPLQSQPKKKIDSLNQALVDPHLKRIPSLTPLPTRRLPRRDLQHLSRQPHGAFDAQVLGLGALDQLLADFFEGLHFARGERDADFVDFLVGWSVFCEGAGRERREEGRTYGAFAEVFFGLVVGHFCGFAGLRRAGGIDGVWEGSDGALWGGAGD